jgi:hypothetical protein
MRPPFRDYRRRNRFQTRFDVLESRQFLAVLVQPDTQYQHAVARLASRQGVDHRRLNLLLAARAPVAMNQALGDFRLQVGNVFDIANAILRTALQAAAALRLVVGSMFRSPVDPLRNGAPRNAMALLGPGPLSSFALGRFFVDRNHPSWTVTLPRFFFGKRCLMQRLKQDRRSFYRVSHETQIYTHDAQLAMPTCFR